LEVSGKRHFFIFKLQECSSNKYASPVKIWNPIP
jgi:hypothetical protein